MHGTGSTVSKNSKLMPTLTLHICIAIVQINVSLTTNGNQNLHCHWPSKSHLKKNHVAIEIHTPILRFPSHNKNYGFQEGKLRIASMHQKNLAILQCSFQPLQIGLKITMKNRYGVSGFEAQIYLHSVFSSLFRTLTNHLALLAITLPPNICTCICSIHHRINASNGGRKANKNKKGNPINSRWTM